MRRGACAVGLMLALVWAFGAVARADEIRLKDGSKIVGMIVDYQDDSFKVLTAYGFAMIRKDSIAQIVPEEPVKPSEAAKAAPAPSKPANSTAQGPTVQSAAETRTAPAVKVTSLAMPAPNLRRASSASATSAPTPSPTPRPAIPTPVSAPLPIPAPAPPAAPPAPAPLVIKEGVQGTVYRNQTYNFELYRPPGWDLMPEARKAMPNAITAMGTTDQTTIFVVGRENLRDSLEAHAATAEKGLRQVYENYRPGTSVRLTVNGVPAVKWRFRGMADGHDWAVTALTVVRANDVFTLLGMTYADSDLIQIRDNVIGKMMNSVVFTPAR